MKTYKYIMTCILALVSFLPMQAQTVDKEAMYIYQKDGNVNIFFRNEVTSISIELKDGELYQVVKTGERQHAFPISNIQSVSFVHPVEDTYKPTIIEDEETPTFGKFVDLGLPSGTMWASFNVGASTPEECGGYYAWGETKEKDVYDWSTYIHCDGSSSICHDLGDDISGTEYDVAHVKWGGNWYMPTMNEINELFDNCTSEWMTLNGVNGRKFTSNINGNSIFLPAAGCRWSDNLRYVGDNGLFWSSTSDPSNPNSAQNRGFNSYSTMLGFGGSCAGLSIRPVYYGFQISLSSQKIELIVGESKKINFIRGSGSYTIENRNTEVAMVTINGNTILINALKEGETTIIVTDTQLETTANISVKVSNDITSEIPVAIDLGLPSGTMWASCNVGASTPEEYGGYYAWGETEEKETYTLENYIHCDGSYETYHDLGANISGTEYDVAHVKWGGNWCMPSKDDIQELLSYCVSDWTAFNGIKGMKFTSKINGNSIFLPAAGLRSGDGLELAGQLGYYWSSTSNMGNINHLDAPYLVFGFFNDAFNFISDGGMERNNGRSVRPVWK